MTGPARDFEAPHRRLHDGVLRCALCADGNPEAGQEWCPAAECLICEDCCRGLLGGDPHVISAMLANSASSLCPEGLLNACSQCARGHRRFTEHLLDEAGEEEGIC